MSSWLSRCMHLDDIFLIKVSSQNLDLASQWPVILEFEFGFLKGFCKNPNAAVWRIFLIDFVAIQFWPKLKFSLWAGLTTP